MRSSFALLLLLATLPGFGQSGSAAKVPDPAFLNQVYCYRGDSLAALGRVDGRLENKMKARRKAGAW